MDLNTFKKEQSKLSKALAKHGKAMLVTEFKQFFKDHPEVDAITWVQYTPHFNDGDVCEFSRHDFEFKGTFPSAVLRSDYSADSDWGFDDFISPGCFKEGSPIDKDIDELYNKFDDTDDVFLASFGDGVQVIATRKGFEIQEYDHD